MERNEFREYFDVSRETLNSLDQYAETLANWQKTINLVAPKTLPELWARHFADSAQLVALMPEMPCHTVDLGSGAGFPGLVIAILRAEKYGHEAGEKVSLVESDQRKAAFLREVSRLTGIPVDIHCERIEIHSNQDSFEFVNVVTARALAPMHKLLEYSRGYFAPQTIGLFPKGRGVEGEIAEAKKQFAFECQLVPSVTDPEGRIAVVKGLGAQS